jgi:hypothetical protein
MARAKVITRQPGRKPAARTPNPTVVAKFEHIRKTRPALTKGITVQDLVNFYWVPEIKTDLRRAGISTSGRKLLLAHRLAAWLNVGKKLRRNERYSAGGASRGASSKVPSRKAAAKPAARAAPQKKSAVVPLSPQRIPPTSAKASVSPSRGLQVGTRRHEHKWQYFDATKANGPWFDYDLYASDLVEDAYADWKRDPHIDVRSVKSGEWEYMVDFNSMEQQNVQHTAHTRRKIRRVTTGGQLAEAEANEIRSKVLAQRQAAKAGTA